MPLTFPRPAADGWSDPPVSVTAARARIELAGLPADVHDDRSLQVALTRVAELAQTDISGSDGVGTTLMLDGRIVMTAASAAFVAEVDTVQYGIAQGPCLTAVAERVTVCSNALDLDRRWPDFAAAALDRGVQSVLSLPLVAAEQVVGCLNVYGRRRRAFDADTVRAGEAFAGHAAIAVRDAQLLAVARALAGELHGTLAGRAVVDAALGILMQRHGLDERAAARRLAELATTRQQSVSATARSVLGDAIAWPDADRRTGSGHAAADRAQDVGLFRPARSDATPSQVVTRTVGGDPAGPRGRT